MVFASSQFESQTGQVGAISGFSGMDKGNHRISCHVLIFERSMNFQPEIAFTGFQFAQNLFR